MAVSRYDGRKRATKNMQEAEGLFQPKWEDEERMVKRQPET